ncbi:MAG TPA: cysteine desulfurase family protein [Geminicoccaceae bacterium]|nr:cysteine desulfurase family protein [Geminicoccaceae bacterium]
MSAGAPLRASYLDYNATAPVKPAVIEAMVGALGATGNPSSVHRAGRAARRALERAREAVAALVGAAPDAVVFTSGGTEANNQALASACGTCLVSAVEHDSVLAGAPSAERLPVDALGRVDLEGLRDRLAAVTPALISVMLANNETGVVQPVAEVAELARRHGALFHCDAVQAAGKLTIELTALGADLLTLSAHKLGGPQGAGALVRGDGIEPAALLRGGGQERRWRPGTENLPGIVGFGRAAELALEDRDWRPRVGALRDRLEAEILAVAPAARVFGGGAERLANTSCLSMPGVSNQTQLIAFDLAGIAVSTGSACSSGKVGPSHVLAAMGVDPGEAATAIRVSLGWASTARDVDRFVAAWTRLHARTRRAAQPAPAQSA